MVNITWELKNAEATEAYEIDGAVLSGVVTKAFFKVTGSKTIDGEEVTYTLPNLDIKLNDPDQDSFVSVDAVTKEDVEAWAMASIPAARKKSIEEFITKKIEPVTEGTYNVFE